MFWFFGFMIIETFMTYINLVCNQNKVDKANYYLNFLRIDYILIEKI